MKTRVRYFLNEFLGNTSKKEKKNFLDSAHEPLYWQVSRKICFFTFLYLSKSFSQSFVSISLSFYLFNLFIFFICLRHFVILLFLYLFLSLGFTYLCHFVILMFLYLLLSIGFTYLCHLSYFCFYLSLFLLVLLIYVILSFFCFHLSFFLSD